MGEMPVYNGKQPAAARKGTVTVDSGHSQGSVLAATEGRADVRTLGVAAVVLTLLQINLPGIDLRTQREAQAQVEIRAPAALIWTVLTEFRSYDIWNPYIYPVTGQLHPGQVLEVTLHPGGDVLKYTPAVLSLQPGREFSWGGRAPAAIIERVHTFTLQELQPNLVRVSAKERFQGFVLPFYGNLPDEARRGLEAMTRALRDRAELLTLAPKR